MPPDRADDIAEARRWFAEELRHTAHVRSPAVVEALAIVPRERFAGPGPWRILSSIRGRDYWTTDDADPRHLCHDVLVAIDETRGLNNGQPSLWASLFDQLDLKRGERVIHVGAGAGYYSAILAEIVGRTGRVTALEIDPGLADRSRAKSRRLATGERGCSRRLRLSRRQSRRRDRPQCRRDTSRRPGSNSLAENGRLLVPFTSADWWGAFLLVTRRGGRYPARFASRTGIIPCAGGRNAEAEARLTAAVAAADFTAIKSLRRAPEEPDDTCWLAGDGWWLSTAATEDGPE